MAGAIPDGSFNVIFDAVLDQARTREQEYVMLRMAAYQAANVQARLCRHVFQCRQAFGIIMVADMRTCLLQLVRRHFGPRFPHVFQVVVQVAFAILPFFPHHVDQDQASLFRKGAPRRAKKAQLLVGRQMVDCKPRENDVPAGDARLDRFEEITVGQYDPPRQSSQVLACLRQCGRG